MYLVRVSFTNRFGSPFSWDFRVESDDYAVAVDEAVLTIFRWNSRSTPGTLTLSKTVIKRERQNATGAGISFARQFEQFLDLIHFEVYAAVDLNGVLSR